MRILKAKKAMHSDPQQEGVGCEPCKCGSLLACLPVIDPSSDIPVISMVLATGPISKTERGVFAVVAKRLAVEMARLVLFQVFGGMLEARRVQSFDGFQRLPHPIGMTNRPSCVVNTLESERLEPGSGWGRSGKPYEVVSQHLRHRLRQPEVHEIVNRVALGM